MRPAESVGRGHAAQEGAVWRPAGETARAACNQVIADLSESNDEIGGRPTAPRLRRHRVRRRRREGENLAGCGGGGGRGGGPREGRLGGGPGGGKGVG